MGEDIHDYERRLENELRLVRDSGDLSKRNKELILGFCEDRLASGISKGKVQRRIQDLRKICLWLDKNLDRSTKADVKRVLALIEGTKYALDTKRDLRIVLKQFYRWFYETGTDPDLVAWFKTHPSGQRRLKLPEEMLSEEDVLRMVNATSDPCQRAAVMTLYESGLRIGEFLGLEIKHVIQSHPGFQLVVSGKTGSRRVRVIVSEPYLVEWLNKHPFKDNPDADLWLSTRFRRRYEYARMSMLLKELARKANVRKRIYPHIFRHSRATYLANHLTEAQMKEYFGWTQASEMASIYVHLSGRDVDNAILKVYGIENNGREKEQTVLQVRVCTRCQEQNETTNRFCSRCGMPLDEKARVEILQNEMRRQKADGMLDELIKDQEFREMLMRKVGELGTPRA